MLRHSCRVAGARTLLFDRSEVHSMRNYRKSAVALAVGLAVVSPLLIASQAQAQTYDKKVVYTFSSSFEMPGVTLQPGQYVFRLADPNTTRRIIQVASEDEKRVYGTFFSIPLEADEVPKEPEVRFYEAASGAPPAIRAVWYPGERTGREFIYPREQATRIARGGNDSVLTTTSPTSTAEETRSGDLARVNRSGETTPADATNPGNTAAAAGQPNQSESPPNRPAQSQAPSASDNAANPAASGATGQDRTLAQDRTPAAQPPAGSANAPTTTQARAALPQTSSSVPTVALAGALLLLLGLGLRAWTSTAQ
jgi:hypothetical protein